MTVVLKLMHVVASECLACVGINQVAVVREAGGGTLSPSSPGSSANIAFCAGAGQLQYVGTQHSSLHPTYVTAMDWTCSENIGTGW